MLYEENINEMLATLKTKVAGIANCIQALVEQGYEPNKVKSTKLAWSVLLINAYKDIDVLNEEQHRRLDVICYKVLNL